MRDLGCRPRRIKGLGHKDWPWVTDILLPTARLSSQRQEHDMGVRHTRLQTALPKLLLPDGILAKPLFAQRFVTQGHTNKSMASQPTGYQGPGTRTGSRTLCSSTLPNMMNREHGGCFPTSWQQTATRLNPLPKTPIESLNCWRPLRTSWGSPSDGQRPSA